MDHQYDTDNNIDAYLSDVEAMTKLGNGYLLRYKGVSKGIIRAIDGWFFWAGKTSL